MTESVAKLNAMLTITCVGVLYLVGEQVSRDLQAGGAGWGACTELKHIQDKLL